MASSSKPNDAPASRLEPPESMSIKPKSDGETLDNVVTLEEGDILDPKQDADAAVLAANGHDTVMTHETFVQLAGCFGVWVLDYELVGWISCKRCR